MSPDPSWTPSGAMGGVPGVRYAGTVTVQLGRQYDDLTCLHMAGLIEEGLLPLHVAARVLKSPAAMTRRPGFDPGPRPVGAGVDHIDGAYGDHPRPGAIWPRARARREIRGLDRAHGASDAQRRGIRGHRLRSCAAGANGWGLSFSEWPAGRYFRVGTGRHPVNPAKCAFGFRTGSTAETTLVSSTVTQTCARMSCHRTLRRAMAVLFVDGTFLYRPASRSLETSAGLADPKRFRS